MAETGGFGDHVVPYHSPKDTAGEWLQDPFGKFGDVYSGPGKIAVLPPMCKSDLLQAFDCHSTLSRHGHEEAMCL
jgi:hypothetical protein